MREDVMGKLEGKVAIITGAGSGMGRASALLFAQEGAKVVVADVDEAGGKDTVAQIEQAGGTALFVRTDVSRAAEVQRLVSSTVARFGKLDVLFNNAGIEGEV